MKEIVQTLNTLIQYNKYLHDLKKGIEHSFEYCIKNKNEGFFLFLKDNIKDEILEYTELDQIESVRAKVNGEEIKLIIKFKPINE